MKKDQIWSCWIILDQSVSNWIPCLESTYFGSRFLDLWPWLGPDLDQNCVLGLFIFFFTLTYASDSSYHHREPVHSSGCIKFNQIGPNLVKLYQITLIYASDSSYHHTKPFHSSNPIGIYQLDIQMAKMPICPMPDRKAYWY